MPKARDPRVWQVAAVYPKKNGGCGMIALGTSRQVQGAPIG